MWAAYHNYRTLTTLEAIMRLTLQMRRCLNPACPQVRKPYRPASAGRLALPQHEFGLDVLTFIGTQRYAHHSSVPTIHQALVARGMAVAPRRSPISWSAMTNGSLSPSKTRHGCGA
jgi:hypothetical protein